MPDAALVRRIILGLLVGFFLCWPPLHMILSSTYGFSSWKFAGWGMYATPYTPKNEMLHVYVFPRETTEPLLALAEGWLQAPTLKRGIEVYHWRQDQFRKIQPRKKVASLVEKAKLVKLLGSASSVESLVESVQKVWDLDSPGQRMLVLVVQPRVHPKQRLTYAEVNIFTSEGNDVKKVGTFKTDESDIGSLIPGFFGSEQLHSANRSTRTRRDL